MTAGNQALEELRQRLAEQGEHALADHELLALLLGPSAKGSALIRAVELAETPGGIAELGRARIEELARLPGLGPAGAARLLAALELGRRLAAPGPLPPEPIRDSTAVARWFRTRLKDRQREGLHALLLDGKHRPIRHLCIAQGSWNSCPVDPKVIFAACLRRGASALILIHNHPSGDPTPSREDLSLTERLVRAGQILGVRVLDHLVVGREGCCSMAEAGLLP